MQVVNSYCANAPVEGHLKQRLSGETLNTRSKQEKKRSRLEQRRIK